jgi:hypothetical protein
MRIVIGSVNGAMAIGTACHISLSVVGRAHLGDRVAGGTDPRLIRAQEVLRGGTMRRVAEAAVLRHREMFVDPGPCLSLMTALASLVLRSEIALDRPMWRVTGNAIEHSLAYGMMRGQIETRADLAMAIDT